MEFKGTKDNWVLNRKCQTIEDSEGYGIAQQNGIKNSEKWLYDALLISKAPEMLDMLNKCHDMCDKIKFPTEGELKEMTLLLKQLIKEATELPTNEQ